MRIVNLHAENIKRLVAVDITPTGDLVQITGPNGAGKTSVLDSIWWALSGLSNIQAQPIRRGAESAIIKLDLGDIRVTRKFSAGKPSTITVENADGFKSGSPQKLLDGLMGALTFDPLAFMRMEPGAQLNQLRRLVTIEVDIDALAKQNQIDYATRTEINREHNALAAQAKAIVVQEGLPDAPIDESAMLAQVTTASTHNAEIAERKARRERVADSIGTIRREAARIAERAAEHRRMADEDELLVVELEAKANVEQKRLDEAEALPEPIDIAELTVAIENARIVNAAIEKRTRRALLAKAAEDKAAESEALTKVMEERSAERAAAIAAAKMPVEGLGIDGVVTFNGLPLDQASDAEQLRVSCALAMAMNPKLRVLRIRDGALLDPTGMMLLAELAKESDFQIWVETPYSNDKLPRILIKDGAVTEESDAKGSEAIDPEKG